MEPEYWSEIRNSKYPLGRVSHGQGLENDATDAAKINSNSWLETPVTSQEQDIKERKKCGLMQWCIKIICAGFYYFSKIWVGFFSNSCAQEKPTATLIISLPTGLVDPSNLLPPVIPALSSRNKEKEPWPGGISQHPPFPPAGTGTAVPALTLKQGLFPISASWKEGLEPALLGWFSSEPSLAS